jgi:hypothetical protein
MRPESAPVAMAMLALRHLRHHSFITCGSVVAS